MKLDGLDKLDGGSMKELMKQALNKDHTNCGNPDKYSCGGKCYFSMPDSPNVCKYYSIANKEKRCSYFERENN